MKTILVDAMHSYIIDGKGIFWEMHELLETFPNPKIIVTNADDQQFVDFGLATVAYQVFTRKHHPEKTDPTYFKQLLETYELTANEVVYFEHDAEAVKSATSVGIASFHYDPIKKDLEALKQFLMSNLDE